MSSRGNRHPALAHRRQAVTLRIMLADASPLAGREIVAAQRRHEFLFGCNGFAFVPAQEARPGGAAMEADAAYSTKFLNLFNYATLPFYWSRFEPARGRPATAQLRQAAEWCRSQGLLLKGHPLCWFDLCPEWLAGMPVEEVLAAQLGRIRREIGDFAGTVDIWDVVNEAAIMPVHDKFDNAITRMCKAMGRVKMIAAMFSAARAANPGAFLILNDYDTTLAYDVLIESCLGAGVKIDALGIQSHMHAGPWGEEKTLETVARFARFNLPLHFTEMTVLSGRSLQEQRSLYGRRDAEWPTTPEGEERQAEEVSRHYRLLFSQPAVKAVTWWDFSDGKWLGAPGGLIRKDGTVKPAYAELRRLIKEEWWTSPTKLVTDAEGKARIEGFLGEYELEYEGRKIPFKLQRGEDVITLRLHQAASRLTSRSPDRRRSEISPSPAAPCRPSCAR